MKSLKQLFFSRPFLKSNNICRGFSSTSRYGSSSNPSREEKISFRPTTSQAITMMDIGTRDIFSEDHDIFRESARKYFQEECIPNHEKWDEDGQISREAWLKAGEQGFLGIDTDDKFGGVGADFKYSAIFIEEQSYANSSGPGFPMHTGIVMPYLTRYGTMEQLQRLIPDMTSGKKIGALAMTEPGAGSDVQGIRTNARKDGDDWILNGSKTFITNGYMCDVVIVAALTDTGAKSAAHGCTLFIVEEGMPGFRKGKKLKKMGLKSQDTSELFFEDVRLPSSAVLGKANHGFFYLMNELPQERLIIGLLSCASTEWMFEETRKYLLQRKAFGKTLTALQTIQHKLAEMKTEICVARTFVDHCIELHHQKRLDTATASMCKYWVTDLQNKVAYNCVQLHGGWGYMTEYPISKAYCDARLQPIYGGTNEIMKELIKRQIIDDKRL